MPDGQKTLPTWLGGIFLIALLGLAFSAGLMIEGLWLLHTERVQAEDWPAVEANVVSCFLTDDAPISRKNGRITYYSVLCEFRYTLSGADYESSTRSSGYQAPKSADHSHLPAKVIEMERWIHQHPKGSLQTIHYDPRNPQNISLAGADEEIQAVTGRGVLEASRGALPVAVGILALGFVLRLLINRRPQSGQESLAVG